MQPEVPEERVMENDLEDIAKKRVQARMAFVTHFAMYSVMNMGLLAIWYVTGAGYPWFMWPLLGWGIGILAHAISLVVGPGSVAERRAIDRELQRLRATAH
jgi:hypothetical protein